MLLEGKNAIIYGGGGSLGGGVARTFAREGANVFLAGRTRASLEAVAKDTGAEVAQLDALDAAAVEEHARAVAAKAGSLDVSFNLVSRGDVQGIPLLEMSAEDIMRPVTTGLTATVNTARSAARIMVEQGSGAILSLTSGSAARGQAPGMGGTETADAAMESFLRSLALEVGPEGVRVLGIYTAGVVESLSREKLTEVSEHAPDPADVEKMIAGMAILRRAPRLQQVADTAAFLASDRASGMTATIANVTCGLVVA